MDAADGPIKFISFSTVVIKTHIGLTVTVDTPTFQRELKDNELWVKAVTAKFHFKLQGGKLTEDVRAGLPVEPRCSTGALPATARHLRRGREFVRADQRGMIVPMFMMPLGSKARFNVSSMGYEEPYSSVTQRARALPMPWWCTIEPPYRSVSSQMIEMIGR